MRIAAIGTAFALILGASQVALAQSGPLKIGVLLPMTGSGAPSGLNSKAALDMAQKEINGAGGMMGRQIELVYADDQSDPTRAVGEARRLAQQEKVELFVGPLFSQLVLAVVPVLNEAKIAAAVSAAAPQFTAQFAPYAFSTAYPGTVQGEAIASYIAKERKAKSVAILSDNTTNSKSVIEVTKEALAKAGIRVTGAQEYELKTTDLTPQLLGLRRTNPDVLIIYGVGAEDQGYALKNLLEIGWNVPVAGSAFFGVYAPIFTRIAGPEALKNAWGLEIKALTYCSTDPVGQSDFAKFVARMKATYPDQFDKMTPALATYAYDGIYVLKAAVDAVKTTDATKVTEWIESNSGSIKAIYGPFVASKSSHFLLGADSLVPVENLGSKRADGLVKRAGC